MFTRHLCQTSEDRTLSCGIYISVLEIGRMQLKWHQILYFHFMCIGLALSQNSTLGNDKVNHSIWSTSSLTTTNVSTPHLTTSYFMSTSGTTNTTPTPVQNLTIVNITASSNKLWYEIHVKCEVYGSHSPVVWWTKNGSTVRNHSNIYLKDENKTLVFDWAEVKDVGTYYCHARNSFSYVNASFVLNLIGIPGVSVDAFINMSGYFDWSYGQVILNKGMTDLRVFCYGWGYPNLRVNWKRIPNKIVESLNSSLNARVYESKRGNFIDYILRTLHFKEVYCEDAGIYTCETSIEGYDYVDMDSIELICNDNFNQSILSTSLSSTTIASTPHVTTSYSIKISGITEKAITPTSSYSKIVNQSVLETVLKWNMSAQISIEESPLSSILNSILVTPTASSTIFVDSTSQIYKTPTPSWAFSPYSSTTFVSPSLLWDLNPTSSSAFYSIATTTVPVIPDLDDCYVSGEQDIYRGQNLSLACHGNGYPYPLFMWYLQEQQLKMNSRVRIQGNQLEIFNATINDGGKYRCIAYNKVGNVSCGPVVTVRDIPAVAIWTDARRYIQVGTNFFFACKFSLVHNINVSSTIPKIKLLKDNIPLYQRTLDYSCCYHYYHTVYWHSSARKNSTGKYQCKMTIGAASRYSSQSYLTVGVPSGPVVLEREPETSATGIRISWKPISEQFWNGEEITFQVNVSSLDYMFEKSYSTKTTSAIISDLLPATTYIVTITGKTVFGPTENRTVVVKTIEDIDRCENADSNSCHEYATCKNVVGNYICTCFDGFFGNGKECEGPPQIVAKSPSNIIKDVETNVTLVCTVIADPNPTTIWKHTDADGKMIEIKRTSEKFDGNYTITNARVQNSGTYLCNASNALGYAYYTTKIKIEPVIVNIRVEINLSNKTFKEELKNKSSPVYKELEKDVYLELYNFFNNTPGFEDIEILGFLNGSVKVLFRVIVKVLKPSKERNDVVAVKVGRKIYEQLKTGRIGKFAVAPSTLKLKAEPPPPANVSYSDVRETKVDIFWDPPELHQLFSIKRYYISYLKHGEKKWSNDTVGVSDDQSISFQLDNLESDTFYSLKVTAENDYFLGQESKRMEIRTLKVKVVSPWYYIGPIIAVACVVLLVAVACLVRRVSLSNTWRPVEDERLHGKKREGKTTFQMMERGQPNENAFPNPAFSDTLPKSAWKEIQRTSIELSNETLIPGQFGIKVVRGTFSCILRKNKEACSIKLLKENGTEKDRRELMNELKTISAISSHENILNLIGACTSEDGPLLLVLEFCPRGTLESNLQESDKSREMFINKNKIRLASEIAKGMRHLADSKIVHRDLAAKNILMTADFTPKISNFGFSRDVYEESLYQKLTPSMPSTPWLAIESLTDGLYTTKSDVWSFAVVMWEIETGGDIPYKEYEVAKLVNQLKKGHRLSKPNDASDETYKLMLQCWDENPNNRPTFEKIIEIIQMHLVNYESLVDIPLNINT